jgi:CRP-like cAMP-binding protein
VSLAIQSSPRNQLLRALAPDDLDRLSDGLEPIVLDLRAILETADGPAEHVYFPDAGVASIIAFTAAGRRVEVGLYGRDGMSGSNLALGVARTPHEHIIQVAGRGRRIGVAAFGRFLDAAPDARTLFRRYLQALTVQTAQTAVSNGVDTVEQRLARWLLMCLDRVDDAEVALTHEFMATMLAVRRSSVTVALHRLQAAGSIRAHRGYIQVLDRARLVELAGGSYGVAEAEYDRLVGAAD